MWENESLGKYVQKRLREKGIEDKTVADTLNLSVKTVPKIYLQTEIPCDRIAKISVLVDENLYLDFFGRKEPLKSLLNRDKQQLIEIVSRLESLNDRNAKTIQDKDRIIELQNKLILELEKKLKH